MQCKLEGQDEKQEVGVSSVTDVVRCGRLRWFGHLERKCVDDWVSACRVFEVPGDKGRGRGRKTWGECVDGDMIFHSRFGYIILHVFNRGNID